MSIETSRKKIDKIDTEVIKLIKKRFDLLPDIINFKKTNGMAIYQPKRELELLACRENLADKLGLSKKFVNKLFCLIMEESRHIQESLNI